MKKTLAILAALVMVFAATAALAEGSANAPSVTSFIPGYKVVSGLDLDAYQVHARCILLDTKTGYRSQYLAISGVVNL